MKTKLRLIVVLLMILVTIPAMIDPAWIQKPTMILYYHYTNTLVGTDVLDADALRLKKDFETIGVSKVTGASVSIQSENMMVLTLVLRQKASVNLATTLDRLVKAHRAVRSQAEFDALKTSYQAKLDDANAALAQYRLSLTPEAYAASEDVKKALSDAYHAQLNLIVIAHVAENSDADFELMSVTPIEPLDHRPLFWLMDVGILVIYLVILKRSVHD